MGFRTYPETKSADANGRPCGRRIIGLASRRLVIATEMVVIGKEANELEQVETGIIDALEEVRMMYPPDGSEELRGKLRAMTVKEAMAITGLSRRKVCYLRSGQRHLNSKF